MNIQLQQSYSELRRSSPALSVFDSDYPVLKALHQELDILRSPMYEVILDFGAGNAPYRSLFRCTQYLKADVSQNADSSIDILLNGPQIPLPDASVDLVLCVFVLEHIQDYRQTLDEVRRVVKRGGRVFIAVPYLSREHETPHDYLRFTSFMAQSMFQGYSSVRTRKAGNAWHAAFSLLNEMHIKNGEVVTRGRIARAMRRLVRMLIPLLNLTLFRGEPRQNDSVFTSLLITATK